MTEVNLSAISEAKIPEAHLSSGKIPEDYVRPEDLPTQPNTAPFKSLKAYVVSDVHLNDHPFDRGAISENPRRRHFRRFLSEIIDNHNDQNERLILVLNGDIVDMTGSWFGPVAPWEVSPDEAEAIALRTLQRIVDNNRSIFGELARLLSFRNTELYYVIGNHDAMLGTFPATQDLLRCQLATGQPHQGYVHFVRSLEIQELGMYIEHGHLFDPFNTADKEKPVTGDKEHPHYAFGDYINILLVNRFVERCLEKMAENGYTEPTINELRHRLHDIEYLRPLALVPLWIQSTANHFKKHPENKGKKESIDAIILAVVAETLDVTTTRPLFEKLNLPPRLLTPFLHWMVKIPSLLPAVSWTISNLIRRSHSNQYQYKQALKLHQQKGYRFITFGHTHVPSVKPLSDHGYYFNTASWKPVINLFKTFEFDEANLEYLTPNVRFNKIEYSGILSIEKDLTHPGSVPRFALQTIQTDRS